MSGARHRKNRPGRGSLALIGAFLVSSALIRMGTEAGQAWALQSNDDASDSASSETQTFESPTDTLALLKALQAREHKLKLRERQFEDRMQALSIADQQIEKRLAALVQAEETLRATIALSERASEDDLSKLTSVYESMKPKDAAALFEEMAPEFAAGFLGRMSPPAAAGIMAGLSPHAAYTVSVILAGRNAEVPRE